MPAEPLRVAGEQASARRAAVQATPKQSKTYYFPLTCKQKASTS